MSLPDAELLDRVADGLPQAWTVRTGAVPDHDGVAASFTVAREPNRYLITDPSGAATSAADSRVVVGLLRTMLRRAVGASLEDLTCVEACVVGHRGHAIMLPARALAGTTTLAQALVAVGAEPHSDEFALIDREGRLVSDREVGSDAAAHRALPLGLVALTVYRPGSEWTPRCISPAEGVVALMGCALGAHERPADTLAALRSALQDATVLEGERGEAGAAAAALLEAVVAKSSNKCPESG